MMRTEMAYDSLCQAPLALYPRYGIHSIVGVHNLFGSSAVSLAFNFLI